MTERSVPHDAADRLRHLYQLMDRVADQDSLQDLIVRHGPDVVDLPIPYLVTAARNQRVSQWRHTKRDREAPLHESDGPSSFWDPAERVAASDELSRLLDALAERDNRDILVLWRHVQGATDDEILAEWTALGFEPGGITTDAIRQRRSRVRRALRTQLGHG